MHSKYIETKFGCIFVSEFPGMKREKSKKKFTAISTKLCKKVKKKLEDALKILEREELNACPSTVDRALALHAPDCI